MIDNTHNSHRLHAPCNLKNPTLPASWHADARHQLPQASLFIKMINGASSTDGTRTGTHPWCAQSRVAVATRYVEDFVSQPVPARSLTLDQPRHDGICAQNRVTTHTQTHTALVACGRHAATVQASLDATHTRVSDREEQGKPRKDARRGRCHPLE